MVRLGACVISLLTACAPARAETGVYRDHVDPHWFGDRSRFWYRVETGRAKHQYVLVDAGNGTRGPAFDHAKLAAALGRVLGRDLTPDELPIDDLNFDQYPRAITLDAAARVSVLDLQNYQLRDNGEAPSLPNLAHVRPSRDGGSATSITFDNRTGEPVEVYWIDPDGGRRHYATIEKSGSWQAETYAGHVWLVTGAGAKTVGIFEALKRPATAVIDGRPSGTKTSGTPRKPSGAEEVQRSRGPRSPDGKWLVVVSDNNVHLRPIDGGGDEVLSTDGAPADSYADGDVWWSPDSQYFVAMRTEAGSLHKMFEVESSPPDQLQPKLRALEYRKPGDRIEHPRPQLFRVAGRNHVPLSERLFDNPWSIEDVRWNADSSRFTFVYNARGHQTLRVISVEAATGSARSIVEETSGTFIDYSGKYFCRWVGDHELIWMSERDGWNHLWLFDADTGKSDRPITRGRWVVQRVVAVDADHRQIWFEAGGLRDGQDPYYTHFCRVNFDGSGLVVLTAGDGDHHVQWSIGDKYFVDTWSRVDQPPVVELRESQTGNRVCDLERADAAEALAGRGRWPERFVAKGRDGSTDIYGIILYPRDFYAGGKYPVVEQIYAGPQSFYTPKAFRAGYGNAQRIADRGVIVVQCDGMGTSGRSKAFHDLCWKNLRDAGLPDRIAWIKAAAEAHPEMDLSRVGIYGGSAGGQNAMAALLWHHDFYKVAVADCGCHDNRMDKIWWNEQWMGWPVGPEYAENSNAVNAHLLEGKLMLVVGELDDNVDPASTMQVVNALEKANKDFELVIVTGARHGAAETPYGSRRRSDFLIANLLGTSAAK